MADPKAGVELFAPKLNEGALAAGAPKAGAVVLLLPDPKLNDGAGADDAPNVATADAWGAPNALKLGVDEVKPDADVVAPKLTVADDTDGFVPNDGSGGFDVDDPNTNNEGAAELTELVAFVMLDDGGKPKAFVLPMEVEFEFVAGCPKILEDELVVDDCPNPKTLGVELAVVVCPNILGVELVVTDVCPNVLGAELVVVETCPNTLGAELVVVDACPNILGAVPVFTEDCPNTAEDELIDVPDCPNMVGVEFALEADCPNITDVELVLVVADVCPNANGVEMLLVSL